MKTLLRKDYAHHVVISLNRPNVRNAFHPEMIAELTTTFRNIPANTRAILLRGEGKSFCAGADLSWMQSMVNYSLAENQEDSQKLHAMFEAISECPVPIVARIHGHAMGGAVGLAAVCDIVAATGETQFAFSENRLGLIPAVISPFVLRKMHANHARQYMLTAENFDAAKAERAGLVEFVGEPGAVDEFCRATLTQLISLGPEAVRSCKKLLVDIVQLKGDSLKKRTTNAISERRTSAEGQEGLMSFLQKREPSWRVQLNEVSLEAQ